MGANIDERGRATGDLRGTIPAANVDTFVDAGARFDSSRQSRVQIGVRQEICTSGAVDRHLFLIWHELNGSTTILIVLVLEQRQTDSGKVE